MRDKSRIYKPCSCGQKIHSLIAIKTGKGIPLLLYQCPNPRCGEIFERVGRLEKNPRSSFLREGYSALLREGKRRLEGNCLNEK